MTYDKSVCLSYIYCMSNVIIKDHHQPSYLLFGSIPAPRGTRNDSKHDDDDDDVPIPSLISWYVRISPNHGRILSPYHFGCHHFYTKCQRPTPSVDWRFNHDAQLGPFWKKQTAHKTLVYTSLRRYYYCVTFRWPTPGRSIACGNRGKKKPNSKFQTCQKKNCFGLFQS